MLNSLMMINAKKTQVIKMVLMTQKMKLMIISMIKAKRMVTKKSLMTI